MALLTKKSRVSNPERRTWNTKLPDPGSRYNRGLWIFINKSFADEKRI